MQTLKRRSSQKPTFIKHFLDASDRLQVKQNVYEHVLGLAFSETALPP